MMSIRVKICGIRTLETAQYAAQLGADALGFVFYDKSPRNILPEDAYRIIRFLPPFVNKVGVFVDQNPDEIESIVQRTGLDTIQLHGDLNEKAAGMIAGLRERLKLPIILAVRVDSIGEKLIDSLIGSFQTENGPDAYLLDKKDAGLLGGTGKTVQLEKVTSESARKFLQSRIILAGGINPDNVKSILSRIKPFGIDVSSGVEIEKGIKDKKLIESLLSRCGKIK
jgi:phosphoribosylanthranilate isomerase